MSISKKLLSDGERVLLDTHPHARALAGNIIAGILVLALAIIAAIYLPHTWRPASYWIDAILALILLGVVTVWPWLKWKMTTYAITNKRIITRTGVFKRIGHDISLSRITDAAYEKSFGSGTITISTVDGQPQYLRDVPKVENVHALLARLIADNPHAELGSQI